MYLPWTDSWRLLVALPAWTDSQGSHNMTDTQLMFLPSPDGILRLRLLGGTSVDWSTNTEYVTPQVWRLQWNSGSHSYSWTAHWDPLLGGCSLLLYL